MSEINLLRKKADNSSEKKILKIVRILAIALLFLVAVSSIGLFFINSQSPLSSLKKEEEDLESSLSLYNEKTMRFFILKERLRYISDIVSRRPYFNETLDFVLKDAPKDVKINNLSLDKKSLTLTASSPSISSVDTFLNSLVKMAMDKKKVGKVTLNSMGFDNKSGNYFFSLELVLI